MDPDKRILIRHAAAAAVGLCAVFVLIAIFALVAPGMPFLSWICLVGGFVAYRIFIKMISPPKHCPKCDTSMSASATSCPNCGRLMMGGL